MKSLWCLVIVEKWEKTCFDAFCLCCGQVCTGVYKPASAPAQENVFLHGHRDMSAEASLLEPAFVLENVEAAVDLVLRRHL